MDFRKAVKKNTTGTWASGGASGGGASESESPSLYTTPAARLLRRLLELPFERRREGFGNLCLAAAQTEEGGLITGHAFPA